MKRHIGIILIISALATLGWIALFGFNLSYWFLPPEQKFVQSWKTDVALLEKSGKLPKQWNDIREVAVKAANSPAQEWISAASPPIIGQKLGKYRLDVFVIHWLEGDRYGVVIQYNLVDLKNQNTVWELGRTLKLGFVY